MFAFWRTRGAPDTKKSDTFGPRAHLDKNTHTHQGAHTHTHTRISPFSAPALKTGTRRHTHTRTRISAFFALTLKTGTRRHTHTHTHTHTDFRVFRPGLENWHEATHTHTHTHRCQQRFPPGPESTHEATHTHAHTNNSPVAINTEFNRNTLVLHKVICCSSVRCLENVTFDTEFRNASLRMFI